MYLDEIFLSIQGESTDTGIPCIFVRLFGCPVGCSFCDQKQDPKNQKKISVGNLSELIQKKYKGIKNVCITGGEPLVYHDEVMALTLELLYEGYRVSIETSGCFPIDDVSYRRSYRYIMDIKCPSSGVSHKNIYDNLLKLHSNDDVVCVIANREDYDFMKKVFMKYPTQANLLLSPMFDKDGHNVIGKELVDWVLEDKLDCRIQIQLHKILGVS